MRILYLLGIYYRVMSLFQIDMDKKNEKSK